MRWQWLARVSRLAAVGVFAAALSTACNRAIGIFCSNESGTTGAAQAVKGRGSKVEIVGFDSRPILIQQLHDGVVDALVIQNLFKMGETAMQEGVKPRAPVGSQKAISSTPLGYAQRISAIPLCRRNWHPDLPKYFGLD